MCVRCVCECVVEALYVPLEFGGVSVVCDSAEKLFPNIQYYFHMYFQVM